MPSMKCCRCAQLERWTVHYSSLKWLSKQESTEHYSNRLSHICFRSPNHKVYQKKLSFEFLNHSCRNKTVTFCFHHTVIISIRLVENNPWWCSYGIEQQRVLLMCVEWEKALQKTFLFFLFNIHIECKLNSKGAGTESKANWMMYRTFHQLNISVLGKIHNKTSYHVKYKNGNSIK